MEIKRRKSPLSEEKNIFCDDQETVEQSEEEKCYDYYLRAMCYGVKPLERLKSTLLRSIKISEEE